MREGTLSGVDAGRASSRTGANSVVRMGVGERRWPSSRRTFHIHCDRICQNSCPLGGIDPLLGGTQTCKLSHWRFIKRDEKERKDTLYMYIPSVPYNHLFVKRESSLFSSCF